MLLCFKLTNAHTARSRPTLKNDTDRFRNGLVREFKEKQFYNLAEQLLTYLVFVLRVVFFPVINYVCFNAVHVPCSALGFCIISKFLFQN